MPSLAQSKWLIVMAVTVTLPLLVTGECAPCKAEKDALENHAEPVCATAGGCPAAVTAADTANAVAQFQTCCEDQDGCTDKMSDMYDCLYDNKDESGCTFTAEESAALTAAGMPSTLEAYANMYG
eukprot:SAG31_NODE_1579_length_7835_cov_6.779860_6_plen_125_part_00